MKLTRPFLYYALLHLTKEIESHAYGLAALVHVRKGDLEATRVPVPTGPEQRKIAGVLGVVQRAMEQQERGIALTAELKKALLHQLFTAGLRGEPQKQTAIGDMPESWNPTPLGTCCDILSGSLSYTDFLKTTESVEHEAVECMAVKVSDMNLTGNEARFLTANAVRRLPIAFATRKLFLPTRWSSLSGEPLLQRTRNVSQQHGLFLIRI